MRRGLLAALALLVGSASAVAPRGDDNLRRLRGPEVCIENGIMWTDGNFDDKLAQVTADEVRMASISHRLKFVQTSKEDCAGFIYFNGTVKTTPKGLVYAAHLELTVQEGMLLDITTTRSRVVTDGGKVMYVTLWSASEVVGLAANRAELEKTLSREAAAMFKLFARAWSAGR